MCHWLAYSGSPVLVEDLLYEPANSLVIEETGHRHGTEHPIPMTVAATDGEGTWRPGASSSRDVREAEAR